MSGRGPARGSVSRQRERGSEHERAGGRAGPAAGQARPAGPGGEQVEGYHAVRQLLFARRRRARVLWADARLAASGPVRDLVVLAREHRVPVALKAPHDLVAAAQTSAPQGVIAWADPLEAPTLEQLLASPAFERGTGLEGGTGSEGGGHRRASGGRRQASDGGQRRASGPGALAPAPLLVVLDGVTDPGNLGSVLRSAACAGAGGVVVGRHRSAALSPAALKAAAGAAEVVPLVRASGIPAALSSLRAAGFWVVGFSPEGLDDLWTTPLLSEPVALVFGSEGAGLSRLSRERCDALVRIPMPGAAAGLGSLNVAMACAVACFEVARRHAAGAATPGPRPGAK